MSKENRDDHSDECRSGGGGGVGVVRTCFGEDRGSCDV